MNNNLREFETLKSKSQENALKFSDKINKRLFADNTLNNRCNHGKLLDVF